MIILGKHVLSIQGFSVEYSNKDRTNLFVNQKHFILTLYFKETLESFKVFSN